MVSTLKLRHRHQHGSGNGITYALPSRRWGTRSRSRYKGAVLGEQVRDVLSAIQGAGLRVWLDGGWGVDALFGEQSRVHGDVDLVVERDRVDHIVRAVAPLGFKLAE